MTWAIRIIRHGTQLTGLVRIDQGLVTVTNIEGRTATTQLGQHPPEALARLLLAELNATTTSQPKGRAA